jgi:hypothetical protein
VTRRYEPERADSEAERTPPQRRQDHPILQLQRSAGNYATGQILARRAVAPQTGLRKPQAVDRFVHKAVSFFERNGDLALKHYAKYLGAAVNTELTELAVPAVNLSYLTSIDAAGQFVASGWTLVLNPNVFSRREPKPKNIGELTADEASLIATTVYHEARHAEQTFRMARLEAGEHHERGFEMDEDAAKAAEANPLTARNGSALELREAREWRDSAAGVDAQYREAVTSWQDDTREAARLVYYAKPDEEAHVRERVTAKLANWRKPTSATAFIRDHLASARKRRKTTMIADIVAIEDGIDAAEKANSGSDFAPLKAAVLELNKCVYRAYTNLPVEHDAFEAGGAAFDAFDKRVH